MSRQASGGLEKGAAQHHRRTNAESVALLLVVTGFVAARWPFLTVPLVRDEGEYAQLGQRVLEGAIPYLDLYNQKTPLTFYLVAAIQAVAGEGLAALRMATTLYGAVILAVIFVLARRLLGPGAGAWASLAGAMLILGASPVLHTASTEFFMLLWSAVGTLLWYRGRPGGRAATLVLAGACAGLDYQTKQTGIALLGFFWVERCWLAARDHGRGHRVLPDLVRDLGLATLGFCAVLVAVLAYFASHGALAAYVECTWIHNWQYIGLGHEELPRLLELLPEVLRDVAAIDAGLWLLGAAGLAALALRRRGGDASELWLLLALTAGAALFAGRSYRHYYIPLVLPLSIGIGAASRWLAQQVRATSAGGWRKALCAALLAAPWIGPVRELAVCLADPAASVAENLARVPPAATAVDVAQHLASRTGPEDRILIVGSEPEIYFYADRPAASRMVFTYPMTGPYTYASELRRGFLDEIARCTARYVVIVRLPNSLSEWPANGLELLEEASRLLASCYETERVFDVQMPDGRVIGAAMEILRRQEPAPPSK